MLPVMSSQGDVFGRNSLKISPLCFSESKLALGASNPGEWRGVMGPITGSNHEPVGDAEVTAEIWLCTDMHLWLRRICFSERFSSGSRLVTGTED